MQEQELNRYWKTVVETIQDGVMIVDRTGIILSVNHGLEVISGYDRSELIGHPCSALNCNACEMVRERDGGHWCKLFRTGSLKKQQSTLIRKDGRTVPIIKNASILKDADGRLIGAVETMTDISELIIKENLLQQARKELHSEGGFSGIIGSSASMLQVFDMIRNVAATDAPVLILGESGTGKELVAQAVHSHSKRKDKPYIKVNCAALNESLLESELFGHVKGAFTGAYHNRAGRFEAASGGSIFLDEIGDLPLAIQIKLLRVLEERVIERVGDNTPIPVDVRIITATNRDLRHLMEAGAFRADFYYRIYVLPIHLPPLRTRTEDIPLLTEHFLKRICLKLEKIIEGISPEAMQVLMRYHWPGNVREFKSALEFACVTCRQAVIEAVHLPPDIREPPACSPPLPDYLDPDEDKKQRLIAALRQTHGNRTAAAKLLGVSRITVWNWIHRYGLAEPTGQEP